MTADMRFSRHFLNRSPTPSTDVDTVVVIDVLRSFTTVAVALANGAARIYPAASPTQVSALRAQIANPVTIGAIGGGDPIPGFHHGNSPAAILHTPMVGRDIILSTVGGVQGLYRYRHAPRLYAGSLVCAQATAQAILTSGADEVCFVITGEWDDRDGDEDIACADYIEALLTHTPISPETIAQRVFHSDFGRRFTAGTSPHLPRADLDIAAHADRFTFAMPVIDRGEHLLIRSAALTQQ